MNLSPELGHRLCDEGWWESLEPFWQQEPCFYDLGTIKTVLLFRDDAGQVDEDHYFWKFESQDCPEFLDAEKVVVRRYKLHHSMNALLWHDHGDRKIVH
ncbi:MAG: hypothetical protein KC931_21025 [Candidatus Omnitrophica bacterium]|nr:hypothetical protein [Candidatus Omnitrophota bacterium]